MDPRGFPTTLPEFQQVFPDDAACAQYLEHLRWPKGFICPKCGNNSIPYRFAKRTTVVLRCKACKSDISLTAGTVMQASHMPLSTWFWGAYLVTTQTPGQSALQFQRQLGLSRYETAFQLLHKLRSGLVRPARDTIGNTYPVEVDEVLIGGHTRGEGRGVHHMVTVAGAVEIRQRIVKNKKTAKEKIVIYAGRLRMCIVASRGAEDLTNFVQQNISKGSVIRTDGWAGYNDLTNMGYLHEPLVLKGDPDKIDAHLPMIHITFSNFQTWLLGTHHGVSHKHLQAYINEYVFRFNRRFYPMTSFNSALGLAAKSVPPTYESLYSGEWTHPIS